jgi:hypothetical protein
MVGLTGSAAKKKGSAVDPAELPSKGGLSNKTALARIFKLLRLPAWATLTPFLPGGGATAIRKKGVLADAIRRFAAGRGGALTDLIVLLAELPDDVSEDSNAQKLVSEIADQLRAAIAMNPLLKSTGEPLDPKTLLEGPSGKTRISVINLAGLASEEARDSFVNRLQMSLFTFIKRNPNPTGCLYVIDAAQSFAPSGAGTACDDKNSRRAYV